MIHLESFPRKRSRVLGYAVERMKKKKKKSKKEKKRKRKRKKQTVVIRELAIASRDKRCSSGELRVSE